MSIDENTAAKVAKLARIEVESQDLKALANRPKYSALDSSNFCNLFSLKPSNWEKGVDELFLSQTHEIC